MAGFLINGCGASDSYYKLKDLKVAHCPHCREQTLWEVAMLKMKIRVVFIPTVPISTKYAVMCSCCRQGYYITEEQKNFILNNPPSCVEVQPDGVVIHGMGQETAGELPQQQGIQQAGPQQQEFQQASPQQQNFQQPSFQQTQQSPPEPRMAQPESYQERQPHPASQPVFPGFAGSAPVCPGCGGKVREGERFCGRCGTPLDGQALDGLKQQGQKLQGQGVRPNDNGSQLISRLGRRKMCPKCQMIFTADKETCNICGSKLVDKA